MYHKLVLALSADFLEGDLQRIISIYVGGDIWKECGEGEREQFIKETIQDQKGTHQAARREQKTEEIPAVWGLDDHG